MFTTNVGGVNVVKKNVNVVDAVIGRWVVDRQCTLDVLLDDHTFCIEGSGFNFVQCSF